MKLFFFNFQSQQPQQSIRFSYQNNIDFKLSPLFSQTVIYCRYAYDKFYSHPRYVQYHSISNQITENLFFIPIYGTQMRKHCTTDPCYHSPAPYVLLTFIFESQNKMKKTKKMNEAIRIIRVLSIFAVTQALLQEKNKFSGSCDILIVYS